MVLFEVLTSDLRAVSGFRRCLDGFTSTKSLFLMSKEFEIVSFPSSIPSYLLPPAPNLSPECTPECSPRFIENSLGFSWCPDEVLWIDSNFLATGLATFVRMLPLSCSGRYLHLPLLTEITSSFWGFAVLASVYLANKDSQSLGGFEMSTLAVLAVWVPIVNISFFYSPITPSFLACHCSTTLKGLTPNTSWKFPGVSSLSPTANYTSTP